MILWWKTFHIHNQHFRREMKKLVAKLFVLSFFSFIWIRNRIRIRIRVLSALLRNAFFSIGICIVCHRQIDREGGGGLSSVRNENECATLKLTFLQCPFVSSTKFKHQFRNKFIYLLFQANKYICFFMPYYTGIFMIILLLEFYVFWSNEECKRA